VGARGIRSGGARFSKWVQGFRSDVESLAWSLT
jgi:hypothetical protein